jgi:hypothetical protein
MAIASMTTTNKADKTVPSPRPLSFASGTQTQTRTRRLSLNIPNPPIRTPAVPVPARQGSISIHRSKPSSSYNINSPNDRRQGSCLSLSAGRGGWSGRDRVVEGVEKFGDDEWLAVNLGDVGRDVGEEVVCGDEGMERAVEVCLCLCLSILDPTAFRVQSGRRLRIDRS